LIREEQKVAYTYELKRFIRRVEETRPERLAKRREGNEFPKMSLAEKEDRLRKFHPSYKEGSLQELKVGPNKGYGVPPEICGILESWSRIDPDQIDLSKIAYNTDVLIIGGGGAGTAAGEWCQSDDCNKAQARRCQHDDG
jgi:hypothetical protein